MKQVETMIEELKSMDQFKTELKNLKNHQREQQIIIHKKNSKLIISNAFSHLFSLLSFKPKKTQKRQNKKSF